MRGNKKGFTLIEIIIVLIIIAILAAIAVPALIRYVNEAKDKRYVSEIHDVYVAASYVAAQACAEGMEETIFNGLNSGGTYNHLNLSDVFNDGETVEDKLRGYLGSDFYDRFWASINSRIQGNHIEGIVEIRFGTKDVKTYIFVPGEPVYWTANP